MHADQSDTRWRSYARVAIAWAALAGTPLPSSAAAADGTFDLYPSVAPGSESWQVAEIMRPGPTGGAIYSNVSKPQLIMHLPAKQAAGSPAVIYLPGGALRALYVDQEARDVIDNLTSRGIAVFVLKYRTLQLVGDDANGPTATGRPPPPLPRVDIRNGNANPAPGDARLGRVLQLAINDCELALHILRAHASEWHIDPARIGLLGASAGGGVAIGSVIASRPGTDPYFLATLYGPSLEDVHIGPTAPPLFVATETNHGPVTEGLLALFQIWHAAGRPAEFHSFDVPQLPTRASLWLPRFDEWLVERGFLDGQR